MSRIIGVRGEQLIISELPDSFVLECVTRIEPQNNTALEGVI